MGFVLYMGFLRLSFIILLIAGLMLTLRAKALQNGDVLEYGVCRCV